MIDINQNYTQIRNQALRQANKIKGGHDKELRNAPGANTLYLKTNKSNIFGRNKSLRTSKREGVAPGLKKAIDREFGNLKIDGRTLGDLVFAKLENQGHDTKLLKASDFKLIDKSIADVLKEAASTVQSQSPQLADQITAHAEHFRWLADSGATGKGTTQMESKVNAVLQFKDAIAKDALLAGKDPQGAHDLGDGVQSHLYNDSLDITAGVKPKHIDKARELMSAVGVQNTPHLNEIAHEHNLRTKMYSAGKQMQASFDRLGGYNNEHIKALAKHGAATLKGLNNYLANPNGPRPNFGEEFARNLQFGHAILAQLKQSNNPDTQLISELQNYLNVTSEMATAALPPSQRYNLALHPPQVLVSNKTDPTYGLMNQSSGLHAQDPAQILPQQQPTAFSDKLYSKDSDKADLFTKTQQDYHSAVADAKSALEQFQQNPSDKNLANLNDRLNKANIASDRYLQVLQRASTKYRDNVKTTLDSLGPIQRFLAKPAAAIHNKLLSEDGKASKELHAPLRQTRLSVQQTKETLQSLTRQAGLVNDQRNAIANGVDLPQAHDAEQNAGFERQIDNSHMQDLQKAQQQLQRNLQGFMQPNQQASNQVIQHEPSIADSYDSDFALDNHINVLGTWQQLLRQLGHQIDTSKLDNGLQDLTQGLNNVTNKLQVVMDQNDIPTPQQMSQLNDAIETLQADLAKVQTPAVGNLQKELISLRDTLESFGNWAKV